MTNQSQESKELKDSQVQEATIDAKSLVQSHHRLCELLQRAYSAEMAASFAYVGHAASLRDQEEIKAINQIEQDEWEHRDHVLRIMQQYEIPIRKWYEFKFRIIGKVIGFSCHIIGWFMPYFFAGRLESGNVCEYFRMMRYFHELDLHEHDQILYDMGMKEKEHEVYFLEGLKHKKWLPIFERIFRWGSTHSSNDVDLENKFSVPELYQYCERK